MKRLSAALVVLLCTGLAVISICSACFIWAYQPEIPQRPQN